MEGTQSSSEPVITIDQGSKRSSRHRLGKKRRDKLKNKVRKEIDASEGESSEYFSELEMLDEVDIDCIGRTVLAVDLKYAEIALKSYEERQGTLVVVYFVLKRRYFFILLMDVLLMVAKVTK